MSSEIVVVAVLQGTPGSADKIIDAVRPCVAASRTEAGCNLYTCNRDQDKADRFVFIERWANAEALDAHGRSAHFQALGQALAPFLAEPLQISKLIDIDN